MFSLNVGEETFTDLLCHMAQVQVEIVDLAGIDCFSQCTVSLVGHTVSDPVHFYQFAINLGTVEAPVQISTWNGVCFMRSASSCIVIFG